MWLKTFPLNDVGEGRIPTVLVKSAIRQYIIYYCMYVHVQ